MVILKCRLVLRLLLCAVSGHVAELVFNNHLDPRMSLGGPSHQNLMAGCFEIGAAVLPSYLYTAAFERLLESQSKYFYHQHN